MKQTLLLMILAVVLGGQHYSLCNAVKLKTSTPAEIALMEAECAETLDRQVWLDNGFKYVETESELARDRNDSDQWAQENLKENQVSGLLVT